jgi:hypothetical protein
VSNYGLDDRAIEVRFPAEAKDFSSSLCVQTGSGAHSDSYTMGTGGVYTLHLKMVEKRSKHIVEYRILRIRNKSYNSVKGVIFLV